MKHRLLPAVLALVLAFPAGRLTAQSNPNRGLWVGEIALHEVNEVTVPLDANNVPRAPDPNVTTPTADAASMRLILHVDAAGRTTLLKHVAILSRKAGVQESENDLSLVTDQRLYGAFPPQPAQRISSVVFDFGDARATAAVDEIVGRAASAAATAAQLGGATLATVTSAAQSAANAVVAEADAQTAFSAFLQNSLNANAVRAIANGGADTAARTAATTLRNGSFYGDTRGLQMLDAIQAAVAALPSTATQQQREQAALNTAAAFAETDSAYDRFLAGELFGDMIDAAAQAAAEAAANEAARPIAAYQSAESGAQTALVSAAHGLATNNEIVVAGAPVAAYNGLRKVTKIDDDSFRIAVPFVTGGAIGGYAASTAVAPLTVESPAHGLEDGDRITIYDSLASYNGSHFVSIIDADHFSIDLPFESDPLARGVWSTRSGAITGYEGTADGSAGIKVTAPGHGLNNGQQIEIRGAGVASYNGLKTITRIDDNSFSIAQAFGGNPSVKGSWDLPVAIASFAPPPVVPTLVSAPAHGLATGDRILISGAGKAAYNGGQVVTVVNANAFSIPVSFDTATGNPTTKGNWQPGTGGFWRPTAAIRTAIGQAQKVVQARSQALSVKVSAFSDTRAPDAVEGVLGAILLESMAEESALAARISAAAEQAGWDALADAVPRYPRPTGAPTTDYTSFVRSSAFSASVATAASAAATGAMKEKGNLLATPTSIRDKALQAAIEALTSIYSTASRTVLGALPMEGDFGPGGSGLSAEIRLPANHPTNPFRHRRHPDHTTGFDIRRLVHLSFLAASAQPLRPASYGVDRISGIYEEEIFGLHKPLGPNQDIGLKVRGTFELNRVSLIDTLNGR